MAQRLHVMAGPLAGLVLTLACVSRDEFAGGVAAKPPASTHVDESDHQELPRKVRLRPEVVRDAGIQTTKVLREQLLPTVTLQGEVAANPDKSARVSSPVPGRVEQVLIKEGDVVKKGTVIAVLRVPDLGKVRGALVATIAKAKAARASEVRLKYLLDNKLASEQSYVDAKAQAEALDAEAAALSHELAAVGAEPGTPFLLSLRAPIAGVVLSRDAVLGQPISAEHVLAYVADLDEVWFLARVFEKDLGRLQLDVAADVELNAFPKERFPGVLEYIGQQIDPVGRTVIARVRVPNVKGRLRLGLFGMARVMVPGQPSKGPVLVVPISALVDVAGKTVVFVRQPDGDYELHDVMLGESAPGKVEIVSGLRVGEEVVSQGVFTLKSVVLKSTLADGD